MITGKTAGSGFPKPDVCGVVDLIDSRGTRQRWAGITAN